MKKLLIRSIIPVVMLIGVSLLLTIFSGGDLVQKANLISIMRNMTVDAILGMGALLIILTGNVDLSCGYLASTTGCISACMMVHYGISTGWSIAAALVFGTVVGIVEGVFVAYVEAPAFIVTLGARLLLDGFGNMITHGISVYPLNTGYANVGQGMIVSPLWLLPFLAACAIYCWMQFRDIWYQKHFRLEIDTGSSYVTRISTAILSFLFLCLMYLTGFLSSSMEIVLALALVLHFILQDTSFGRKVYAIGGNRTAVRYSGINIRRTLVAVFALNGLLASFAGILLTTRQSAGMADSGNGLELEALAVAAIGGTSFTGGGGSVVGVVVGALLLTALSNGMTLVGFNTYWKSIVKGLVLVAAVTIDILYKKYTLKRKNTAIFTGKS